MDWDKKFSEWSKEQKDAYEVASYCVRLEELLEEQADFELELLGVKKRLASYGEGSKYERYLKMEEVKSLWKLLL